MTYTIKISDSNGSEIIDMEDVIDVWGWFENYCKTAETGETIELLKDGKTIQTHTCD